jgi:hypothetical protein
MSYFWWYLVDKTNSLKIKAILDGLGWPVKIKELSVNDLVAENRTTFVR